MSTGSDDRSEPSDPTRVLRLPDLSTGARFAGRFEIRRRIGTGAAGEVYHAFDHAAGQEVALKVLFPGAGVRSVERMRRELRLVRRLSHPGIVRIWDIGEHEGLSYLVAEHLDGESLRDRLAREKRLSPGAAEEIFRDVLDALDHAHRNGVIHRDVKPSNILLVRRPGEDRKRAVLIDFGLARHPEETAELTATGRFVGTPQYCAPERIRGEEEVGAAADLYACGVVLWEMLAGLPPFRGSSELDVLNAHLVKPPPNPSREMPAVPSRLRALALHLLEKDPRNRPASAAEAVRLLRPPRGSARLRETVARLRSLPLLPQTRIGAVIAPLAVVAAVALGWWGLVPVAADVVDSRLVWRTRSGVAYDGPEIPGAARRAATLVRKPLRPFPSAIVSIVRPSNPAIRGAMRPAEVSPSLVKVDFPESIVRPLLLATEAETESLFGQCPYAFESDLYLNVIPATSADGSPIDLRHMVLAVEHAVDYPAKIVEMDHRRTVVGTFHHPGRSRQILWFGSGPHGRPRVVVSAVNNLLGPRNVIFALDLPLEATGQAPPYTGDRMLGEMAAWYLPLPASGKLAAEVTFDRDVAVVAAMPGRVVRVDLETGTPLDPGLRGGLDPEAWRARRDATWRALADAAGLAELGHLGDAARLLEDFATRETGGPMLRSIPWHRAARLRLAESADSGPAALELALGDVRRASRAESAIRYTLIEAEILARLGRAEEARPVLRRLWGESPPYMYRLEWLILSWRIGETPAVETVAGGPASSGREFSWLGAIFLADAIHRGAADDAFALWESWGPEPASVWGLHHLLLAAAALRLDPPDPSRALRHLETAEGALLSGTPLPIAALRAEARGLADPSWKPSPSEASAIAAEREVMRRSAAQDPIAWFLHGLIRGPAGTSDGGAGRTPAGGA